MSPLLAATLVLSLQSPPPNTSAKGLTEDLGILERAYKALHPGIYRYNTPEQFDRELAKLRKTWQKDRSLREAYLDLSEFLAKIRCGHSYANFFNQNDQLKAAIFDQANKLPFTFRWLGGQMVVVSDVSSERQLPAGSVVEAIDGVPTSRILKKLMRVARADGSNDAKRRADLEIGGVSSYEAFDVFHPLYFPNATGAFWLQVRTPGVREARRVRVTAVSAQVRTARLGVPAAGPNAPVFSLEYPSERLAVLRMPNWVMYNSKWDWRGFISRSFADLVQKGTPNLVIDLRGNEGGDSLGDAILPFLIKEPIRTENFQRYTRYQKVPDDLRPYLQTWDRSFSDWGSAAKLDPNGFYKLTRLEDLATGVIQPSKSRYLGRTFVIIGPENSSATFEFARRVKLLKAATLVGRTTGGSQRGINGGGFFFMTLPNSRIEVDVPLIAQLFPDDRPDSGISPDILVEPTPLDVARGRDAELDKIKQIIGG